MNHTADRVDALQGQRISARCVSTENIPGLESIQEMLSLEHSEDE
jgi:hypothetical protein